MGDPLDTASYSSNESIITTDVCVIGGGSSGTYTAVRLTDHKKRVFVVEARADHLGGHAESYTDPATGLTLDLGVIVFGHLKEVKDYFARFGVPLKLAPISAGKPAYVDFATGRTEEGFVPPGPEEVAATFGKYVAEAVKYPALQQGFDGLDKGQVPEDLLLPFGEFVEKYGLGDMVQTVFVMCQGYLPLLELSTIYVLKYFNLDLVETLGKGFLMQDGNNVGKLYQRAGEFIGADNIAMGSRVVAMDRGADGGAGVKIAITTPHGPKLILAKKVVSTIPHLVDNLKGYDLSTEERDLFSEFSATAYFAGILRNHGFPPQQVMHAFSKDNPHHLPTLPGIYSINPSPVPGVMQVYFGSPKHMPEEEVRSKIVQAVERIQAARGIKTEEPVNVEKLVDHTPFNVVVSNEAIRNGFYPRLEALQGQRNTFYNGASFHTQDSSVLWRFTEQLLPRLLEQLST